jgi:hypothetical protein
MYHNNFILEQIFWYQNKSISKVFFLERKMYHNNFILEQIFWHQNISISKVFF